MSAEPEVVRIDAMRAFLSSLTSNLFRTAVSVLVAILVVAVGVAIAAETSGLVTVTLFPTKETGPTESYDHLQILNRIGEAEDKGSDQTLFGKLSEVLLKIAKPESQVTATTNQTTTSTTINTSPNADSSSGGETIDTSTLATLTNQTTILNRLGTSSDLATGSTIFASLLALKGNLDVTVSSRLAASSYIAPDNTTIGLISSKIGAESDPSGTTSLFARLSSIDTDVDAAISSRAPSSTALSSADWTVTRAGKLDNLDALISSRADATTALSNLTWTDAKAGYLDAAISSLAPASTALSTATWTATRAGYLDNLNGLVASRLDTTVSSRASASTALSNATWTDAKASYLDAAISSRAQTPAAATYIGSTGIANHSSTSTPVLDSGPLSSGQYEIVAEGGHAYSFSAGWTQLEHRNSANTSNIRTALVHGNNDKGVGGNVWWPRITVAANERIRIMKGQGDTADGTYGYYAYSSYFLFVRPVQ